MRVSRSVRAIFTAATAVGAFALPAVAAAYPGDLDPELGKYGKASFGEGTLYSTVTEADGRLIVAGTGAPYGAVGTLYGATAAGGYDPDFGSSSSGYSQIAGTGSIRRVVALPDGRLLAAATVGRQGSAADLVLGRFSAAGIPDPTFNGGGVVNVDLGASDLNDIDLALEAGGGIVVGASTSTGFLVSKRLADGSADPSFAGGVVPLAVGATKGVSIASRADGGVALAGDLSDRTDHSYVAELGPTGAPDPAFAGDGSVDPAPGVESSATGVALDDQGRVVVSGALDGSPAAFRLTAAGGLDPAFAGDGSYTAGRDGSFSALVIDGTGAIVLAEPDFSVTRLTPAGTPDPGFGRGGRARVSITGADFAHAKGLGLDPQGRIVVVGDSGFNSFRGAYSSGFAVRFLIGGSVRDADADSRPDDRDRCRYDPAAKHHGCPLIDRGLTLHLVDGELGGTLKGYGERSCFKEQRVRLFARRPGTDRAVASARTGKHNKYEITKDLRPGTYYAVAKAKVVFGAGLCEGARSRELEL